MTPPQFNKDYRIADIGFSHDTNLMSRAIRLATPTRPDDGLMVNHCFIVTGDDEVVEAQAGEGVRRGSISNYYRQGVTRTLAFGRLRGYNDALAKKVVSEAEKLLGKPYAVLPATAQSLNGVISPMLSKALGWEPAEWVAKMLKKEEHFFCSELVAFALARVPELRDRRVLQKDPYLVNPQELYSEDELFAERFDFDVQPDDKVAD